MGRWLRIGWVLLVLLVAGTDTGKRFHPATTVQRTAVVGAR